MDTFVERFLATTRKRLFRDAGLFEPYRAVTETDLANLERVVAATIPASLRGWLLRAGFGDLNEQLSFRAEWFNRIDRGQLVGHVMFAQDDCGNFFAFDPNSEAIFFIRRSAHEYAQIADNFESFMEAFEAHDFELQAWTDGLEALPYDWAAV